MTLSFEDIISKKHLEPVDVTIGSLGTVTIHPLSANEAYSCVTESDKHEGKELELYIAGRCCRLLKGDEPTDSEIERFRENNTPHTIRSIYMKGLSANGMNDNTKEDLEKN